MKGNTKGLAGINALKEGGLMRVSIDVTPRDTSVSTFTLGSEDIIQGSVNLDMAGTSSDSLELGSCVATQLSFSVIDSEDWDAYTFAGATIYVEISWGQGTDTAVMPFFKGVIDEVKRTGGAYECIALDSMVLLDKPYDWEYHAGSGPKWWTESYGTALAYILRTCVPGSSVVVNEAVNRDVTPVAIRDPFAPLGDEEAPAVTYRQIASWLCQVMGCALKCDPDSTTTFRMKWFDPSVWISDPTASSNYKITPGDRYSYSRSIAPVAFTGIQVHDGDKTYLHGTEGYVLDLQDNPFFSVLNYHSLLGNVLPRLQNSYYPFTASIIQMPMWEPFDALNLIETDANGTSRVIHSLLTNVTLNINGAVNIESKGESETLKGYASLNPLSSAQQTIINALREQTKTEISETENALLALNDVIANALGLFVTQVPQQDGSTIYYFHNASTLADSTYIFTMTSNGFAYTNHWDGDQTVWTGGIDRNGNAVINMLTLYKLYADYIVAGTMSSHDGSYTIDLDHNRQRSTGTDAISRFQQLTVSGESITVRMLINTKWIQTIADGNFIQFLFKVNSDETLTPLTHNYISDQGGLVLTGDLRTLVGSGVFTIEREDGTEQTIGAYVNSFPVLQRPYVAGLISGVVYQMLDSVLQETCRITVATIDADSTETKTTTIDRRGINSFLVNSDEYTRQGYYMPVLAGSNVVVESGGDLNDATVPGTYAIESNAIAQSLANCPSGYAGLLRVFDSAGTITRAGVLNDYLIQEYITYNAGPRYQRFVYSTDSGATWNYSVWTPTVPESGSSGIFTWRQSADKLELWVKGYAAVTELYAQGSLFRTDDFTLTIPSNITVPANAFIVGSCSDTNCYLLNARISANNTITFRFGAPNAASGVQYVLGYNFYIVV